MRGLVCGEKGPAAPTRGSLHLFHSSQKPSANWPPPSNFTGEEAVFQVLTDSWQVPAFGSELGTGLFRFLRGSPQGPGAVLCREFIGPENWLPLPLGQSTASRPCGFKAVQTTWRSLQ